MMGLDHVQQRQMMAESFEAIHASLTSAGPVIRSTSWFTLNDGLQLADGKLALPPGHPCISWPFVPQPLPLTTSPHERRRARVPNGTQSNGSGDLVERVTAAPPRGINVFGVVDEEYIGVVNGLS
jgi:hypothetical protein